MISEEDLHYIGGQMDADGSFQITVAEYEKASLGYQVSPHFKIEQVQNDHSKIAEDLFRELARKVDSKASIINVDRGEWQNTWKLQLAGTPAISAMNLLKPYLRTKRVQAKKILSVDWDMANSTENGFIAAMEKRDELRAMQGDNDSEYDANFFRREFDSTTSSASDASW